MILVKTTLGVSAKHGIGLFADQFIKKGTVTWEYAPEFDTAFTEEQIARMSEPAQKIFWHYAFYDKKQDKHVLCFDDQRFINHDKDSPNITSTPYKDTAARDIQKGEELLCNYDGFDDTYFDRIGLAREKLV